MATKTENEAHPSRVLSRLSERALSVRYQNVAIVSFLISVWEGVPFSFILNNHVPGYYVFTAAMIVGLGYFLYQVWNRSLSFTKWELLPLILFLSATLTSWIYSTFVAPQPTLAWLMGAYTISPLFFIFFLRAFKISIMDCLLAIVFCATIASALVIINDLLNLKFLGYYTRYSAFGAGAKVVFFKPESAFALVFASLALFFINKGRRALILFFVLAVNAYNVLVATESRLSILATGTALVLCWIFLLPTAKKLLALACSPILLIPAAGFVFEKYFSGRGSLSDYLQNDTSSSWRRLSMEHFNTYFSETYGLGFGYMSANWSKYDNVIAFSIKKGGALYGVDGYGIGLDDVGIMAPLYQFGYFGFGIVVLMSIMVGLYIGRLSQLGRRFAFVATLGFVTIGYLLLPLPMNWFTSFYLGHLGGILWFVGFKADEIFAERKRLMFRRTVSEKVSER